MIETGILCLVLGFIAGYLLCQWECGRLLAELERRCDDLDAEMQERMTDEQ